MNRSILIFIFTIICNLSQAQIDREFWFAIPKETSGHGNINASNNVSFKIAAMDLPATVVISMPANPSFVTRTIHVPAYTSTIAVVATSFTEFATIYNNNAAVNAEAQTGKTNRGILIQADNDITVYYDYDNDYNRDLFSLKGKNALGTDFYCPLQQIWTNGTGYNPRPLSSIEIVATEDNTTVTVYPNNITYPMYRIKGRPNANPFTISLNRGEAYSVVDSSQTPAGHASGTRISSNKNIAVTINDDSQKGANSSCYDLIGDQLVPVNIIGSKYLVMCGSSSSTHSTATVVPHDALRGDQIIVTATQPNTTINYIGTDGTLLYVSVLNSGQTDYFSPDITKANQTSVFVNSNNELKPFYVQHITGIGCELGGAILPPISNCTGSTAVTFYPTSIASQAEVTVNLMVPFDKNYGFTDSVHQPHYYFTLYNSTYPSGFHIPGSWFEKNDSAGWAVLSVNNRNFGNSGITPGKNLIAWSVNRITNTKQLFHLGISNGRQAYTNKYGYFSSFNVTQAEASVASTETQSFIGCLGDTIQLSAHGGLGYTWHYGSPSGPSTYLDDPTSANPKVYGLPSGSHDFYVEVTQTKCFGIATLKTTITIQPKPKADFQLDKSISCAPSNIGITNVSEGNSLSYTWDLGDGTTSNTTSSSFIHQYHNSQINTVVRTIKQVVQDACGLKDSVSKDITLYPEVHAQFTTTMASYCSPRQVDFVNQSNVVANKFIWNFGDNTTSFGKDTTHIYTNHTQRDTIYAAYLIAISSDNCKDTTAIAPILVYPTIEPYFALDKVSGCDPLLAQITNGSSGPYTSESWDFNDGAPASSAEPKTFSRIFTNIYGNRNQSYVITLRINYKGICQKTYSKQVIVYATVVPKVSAELTTVCNNNTIVFKDSTNKNPIPYNYKWDFGDGSSAIGVYGPNRTVPVIMMHSYQNMQVVPKSLKAVYTGSSQYGCSKDTSITITVMPKVEALFSSDAPSGCTPMSISFKNGSSLTSTWVRFWDDENNPSASYPLTYFPAFQIYRNDLDTITKVFHPKLKVAYVYNGNLVCPDSMTQAIQVYPKVVANFSADKTEGNSPLTVNFTNNSKNSTTYFWDFSDNSTSSNSNPVHEFFNAETTPITYKVRLIASNPYSCMDTSGITLKVNPRIATGTLTFKNLEIKFYPNPTKDKISIQYSLQKPSHVFIELLESSGKLLEKIVENNKPAGSNITSIDLSSYQGNLFFVKMVWDGNSAVFKIFKEN